MITTFKIVFKDQEGINQLISAHHLRFDAFHLLYSIGHNAKVALIP